ncbi:MAG: 5-demethoxyubiquinol-8 5-hydroxylase UbiM [Betaproteobacteria bacterium]|nr:5-demethoxyubiquinol-8 5-hydroxylase UbiM [Betaproteobacteria bacterium]
MDVSRESDFDVCIVGAGPAGLALATALARCGLRCQVLEQQSGDSLERPAEDGREIALTHRARRIMERLGMWERLLPEDISPLREARVSTGQSSFVLPFEAAAHGHEALGWLVPNHRIRAVAHAAACNEPNVTIRGDTRVVGLERPGRGTVLHTADGSRHAVPLVVAADSRFSTVRRMAGIGARMLDFGRVAIVAAMEHEAEHGGVAHECFRYGNTLATLPMTGRRSSVVVTLKGDESVTWLALDPENFATRIEAQLSGRLGGMRLVGQRHHYPLVAVYAHRFCGPNFALAGDAAVGMHPVTAHGYNFGLYGVEVLARELERGIGDAALRRYESEHRRTTLPIYEGTNAIVRLFTDDALPARLARHAVLRIARALPPLRDVISRQITGGSVRRA